MPKMFLTPSIDTLPSIPTSAHRNMRYSAEDNPRTIHYYLHIIYKIVDNFQGLRNHHPSFFLSQTVQLLQHRFNFTVS